MPNEAPFDPCKQWLGIDAVQLGNARLVLGIAAREADPRIVIRAADARLNLLHAIAPGPFELARASLVKRVEEARDKVLAEIAAGPARLAVPAADGFAMPPPPAHLTTTVAGAAPPPLPMDCPPQMPPAAAALPPPVPGQSGWGGGERGIAGEGGSIRIRTPVYRKQTPDAGIVLALLSLLVLAAAAGGLAYSALVVKGQRQIAWRGPEKDKPGPMEPGPFQQVQQFRKDERNTIAETNSAQEERERQRRDREEREREEQRQQALEELERQRRERDLQQGQKREEEKSEPRKQQERDQEPRDEPKKDDAGTDEAGQGQAEQFEETLSAVFAAMQSTDGSPDSNGIAELLENASGQARGADAKKRVARWRTLRTYRNGFLDCRRQALAAVKAGDEYDVKDRKIAVVQVDDKVFTYREKGQNKTWATADLPAGLVLAIVTSWFDARPANDLYLGAYHFTKQQPNAGLAREHWEKAAAAGAADASLLLPLLDDPVFTRAMAGE